MNAIVTITETAKDCARAALAQGLTPEHITEGWDLAAGDVEALEEAVGRELSALEWRAAKWAFEQEVREPTTQPLDRVNLAAILAAQVLGDAGDRIWVYRNASDGTPAGGHVVTGGQETPGDVARGTSGPVALLRVQGVGDVDSTTYSEGWAHQSDEDFLYYRDADDSLVGDGSVEDMIREALHEGGFVEALDTLRAEIAGQWGE